MKKVELSESIKNDILLAWNGLVISRLEKGYFDNEDNPFNREARIATAEGLESFLIPCLKSPELKEELMERLKTKKTNGGKFIDAFMNDINYLVNATIIKEESKGHVSPKDSQGKGFFSDPYWHPESVKKAILPNAKAKNPILGKGYIEIVDSIGFIVPTMIHFLKLFKNEDLFKSKRINFNNIENVITEGIKKIINWHIKGEGWGWGDKEKYGLPTNLYSTWTVCETFSEIDDYILKEEIALGKKHPFGFKSKDMWKCIEETKNYIVDNYLDFMIEEEPILPKKNGSEIESFTVNNQNSIKYIDLNNDLYALDILILTYADRKWENNLPFIATIDKRIEETELDEEIRNKLELALYKIIKIYKNPEAKKILQTKEYKFYFEPGNVLNKQTFRREPKWFEYSDKSFLPLLLRVIIQFLMYNIGNPIVLEELATEIYIDLLLTRHKKEPKLRHCWDDTYFGVYTTERAIETLTDLYLYYKEKGEVVGSLEEHIPIRLAEMVSFAESFSFSSRLMQRMKEEGIPAGRLEDQKLFDEFLSLLKGKKLKTEEEISKIEKVNMNIEFAHVKKYLNKGDLEDLRGEVETEIDRVKNEVIKNLDETDYSICVLIDDYNNQTTVTEEKLAEDLEKLGLKPDYVMRESRLTHGAKDLINSISEIVKERVEGEEVITFIETEGKRINLKRQKGKDSKYECGLLAACWYLMRLGIEPYSAWIKYIKKFSNKPFFGKKIRTFLKREKYIEAEEITLNIIKKARGESLLKKIDTTIIS